MSSDERLVTRDEGGVFRSFDVESGALMFERSLEGPVVVMGGASAGAEVAIGSEDGEVELWDLAAEERIGTLSHGEHITGLRFSREADYLVSWGGEMSRDGSGTFHVWSTESLEAVSTVHGERAFMDVVFDPAGGRVAASNGTQAVGVFDLTDGTQVESLTNTWLHTGLRWSLDGSRLASLSTTKFAPVWYMEQRTSAPNTYTGIGAPTQLLRSGERTFVLHENGALATWELETGVVSAIDLGALGAVRGMSNDRVAGSVFLWGEGGVGILNTSDLELHWTLKTAHPVVSAGGDEVSGAGLDAEGHAFSWSEAASLTDLGPASCVAVSPGGEWIATGGEGVEVTLRSTIAGVADRTLSFEAASSRPVSILDLLFHPDGSALSVNTSERRVRIFRVESGEEIAISKGVLLRELMYSSDGGRILGIPGDRHFARMLDSMTGKILRDNETHHQADVQTADIGPESKFAVTGSMDGVLQVWRVEDGQAHWFQDHGKGTVTDVAFWRSGAELGVLAASRDGFLWGVPVHPLNSVDEHKPEPLGSWIAIEETKYALPFSYHPPVKFSGLPEEETPN
jgi:WD40 repeat protein